MGASIIDVAVRAKVSRMTVTRVMRGDPVKGKTRGRVLAAMKELSYVPSPAARAMRSRDALRSSQSSCFALVFGADTQNADEFFCEVTRGVEKEAAVHGLSALQVHWLEDSESSWKKMQAVLGIRGLCGVIMAGQFRAADIRSILKVNPNIVIVDSPAPRGINVHGVESDNSGGCRLALSHLHERGARKPVILAGPPDHYFSRAMLGALNSLRGKFASARVVRTDFSMRSAYSRIGELMDGGNGFDAVFGNDTLCMGAARAISERGIHVPGQVMLAGFDDIPACAYLSPSLTSVRIDKRRLGAESVKTLVCAFRGERKGIIRTVVGAQLIERESTGKA